MTESVVLCRWIYFEQYSLHLRSVQDFLHTNKITGSYTVTGVRFCVDSQVRFVSLEKTLPAYWWKFVLPFPSGSGSNGRQMPCTSNYGKKISSHSITRDVFVTIIHNRGVDLRRFRGKTGRRQTHIHPTCFPDLKKKKKNHLQILPDPQKKSPNPLSIQDGDRSG